MDSETSISTMNTRQNPEDFTVIDTGRESLRSFITNLYGEELYLSTRQLDSLRTKKKKLLCTLAFLRRCRDQRVTPTFVKVKHHISTEAAKKILRRTEEALLRERVHKIYTDLQVLSKNIIKLHLTLANKLKKEHWDLIDRITWEAAEKQFNKSRNTQEAKFKKMEEEKQKKNQDKPGKLQNVVINLSKKNLTIHEQELLALGMNYVIAPRKIPTEDIITEVEAAIKSLPSEEAEEVRQEVKRVLKKAKPPKRNISRDDENAIKDLKKDETIVIMKADKGNATVVMEKEDYHKKIYELLDSDTYTEIKKDPTNKITRAVRELIGKSSIAEVEKKKLLPRATKPPRLYGLPKIHKNGIPLRPIVSNIGSPTYDLSKFLSTKLKNYTGRTSSYVRNSQHFVEILSNLKTDPDDILVSFDVSSLFTNIPLEDTKALLNELGLETDIIELVTLCLSTTYFLYNDKFYEQKNGTAMGSPLSPVIANIFMEAFEEEAIQSSDLKPKCWLRYVDDTFIIWQHGKEKLQEFFDHINGLHRSIKFTMEIEEEGKLPFLDVLVKKTETGELQHTVYRKKTHTDRYLHSTSHHHPKQKYAVINTLLHRAKTISDTIHFDEERKHLEEVLKKNGYTNTDIRRATRKRRKKTEENQPPKGFACLPFVSGVTERVGKILEKKKVQVRFGTTASIQQRLPNPKDRLPQTKSEGIYKLTCECGQSYVGQTGRNIEQRIKEHERDARLKKIGESAVAEHIHETGHKIDFDKVEVITNTKNYQRRVIREAIEIKKNWTFNREDGYYLSNTWKSTLRQTVMANGAKNQRMNAQEAYIRRGSSNGESVQLS